MSACAACTAAPRAASRSATQSRQKIAGWTAAPAPAGCGTGGRWQQRQRRSQPSSRCRATPDPMRSPLFESEIFQKEMNEMFVEMTSLGDMIQKFGDFDTAGKKIFLEHMEGMVEKLKISMARVRLSKDDPLGRELLRQTSVQMLHAGTNMEIMLDSFQQELGEMRAVIAREEATCDPAELAFIKQQWKERFRFMGNLNMQSLSNDPLVAQGAMDPQALKAANEVTENPAAVEKFRDNPALYAFLKTAVLGQR